MLYLSLFNRFCSLSNSFQNNFPTKHGTLCIVSAAWICVYFMWALNVMFNARFVSSRVEEMGALMANLEKANQVSAVPSSQPLIETPRRQDNHLRNQALSLIRRPCSPSSSPTLLVLALAGPWLAGTLSHGAVRAAEDRRERDGCWETRAMWRMRRAVSYLIALIASFFFLRDLLFLPSPAALR